MVVNIEFNLNLYFSVKKYIPLLQKISEYTLNITNNYFFEEFFIECNFVSKKNIKKLNDTLRKKEYVTDVISECFWENEHKTPFLGKLHICINKVKTQAKMYNHSFQRELCFLFVHGLLHLLGYDHENINDEQIMFNLQNKILNYFDIKR